MVNPGTVVVNANATSQFNGTWTAEHGTLSTATIPGTGRTRLLCTSTSGGHARARFTFSANNNAFLPGTIEIPIYLEMTDDQVVYGFVYVARSTSLSEGTWSWNVLLVPGWNYLRLHLSNAILNAPATGDWTDFRLIHIATTGQTGRVIKIYIDEVRVGIRNKPIVVWMFDDNWASAYQNGFPIIRKAGIPCSMAVISSRVGGTDYMTLDQLKEMQDAGWAIINHSATHPQNTLPTASNATIAAELDGCRTYLVRNGLDYDGSASHYVSPFGEISANYLAQAKALGFRSFRVVGNSDANNSSRPGIGSFVDYVWPTLDVAYGNTAQQVIDYVEAGIRANRIIPILNHRISGGTLSTEWSQSNLQTLVDYLVSIRNQVTFMTVPQLFNNRRVG